MIEYLILKPGEADWKELFDFLVDVDDYLQPTLSSRVDLKNYSKKLVDNATNFVAKFDGEIIGIECAYMNKYPEMSFASYWCIRKDFHNSEVAINLFSISDKYKKEYGTKGVWCAVRKTNKPLVRYYLRMGYKVINEKTYPNSDIIELHIAKIYKD